VARDAKTIAGAKRTRKTAAKLRPWQHVSLKTQSWARPLCWASRTRVETLQGDPSPAMTTASVYCSQKRRLAAYEITLLCVFAASCDQAARVTRTRFHPFPRGTSSGPWRDLVPHETHVCSGAHLAAFLRVRLAPRLFSSSRATAGS